MSCWKQIDNYIVSMSGRAAESRKKSRKMVKMDVIIVVVVVVVAVVVEMKK